MLPKPLAGSFSLSGAAPIFKIDLEGEANMIYDG